MSDDTPRPRRRRRGGFYRFVRTLVLLFLVLIAAAVIGYFVWGSRSGKMLAGAVERLRAAGEPVTPADLRQATLPADQNAATLLNTAANLINRQSPAWQAMDKLVRPEAGTYLPLTDQEKTTLQQVVAENEQALALIARAAELDRFDWQIDYSVGLMNVDLSMLNGQRSLASLLEAAALVAHERGDDAQALEYARQMHVVAHGTGTIPTLIGSLVSHGISSVHARLLSDLAPGLRIGSGDSGSVSREALREAIGHLLDEGGSRREILRNGLRGERVFQLDMIQGMLEGRPQVWGPAPGGGAPASVPNPAVFRAIRPLMNENALLMLNHTSALISGLDEPDWQAYQQRVPSQPVEMERSEFRYLLARMMLPAVYRSAQTHYRVANDCHVAAAALGIRAFALDHDGGLPQSLEELVPQYLPHVPRDLLLGGGAPIGYVPDPPRPLVYHAGDNLRDDGGREADPEGTARQNRETSDQVVHLKPQPRPATRPADEDWN